MVNKKRTNQVQSNNISNLEIPLTEITIPEDWSTNESYRFVVVRGGLRVSDKEYSTSNDIAAIAEKEFWQKVVKLWPDGTKIEIVQYDKKKHRIW